LAQAAKNTAAGKQAFTTRGSGNKGHAPTFFAAVLLVLIGTTVPMRGMASVSALLVVVLVTVVFAYLGWWEVVLESLGGLHLEMSAAAFLGPSAVLVVVWLGGLCCYDPLRCMTFTAGQFVLQKEVGDQEQVFDTAEILVEKRPTDYLRHWLLGFGAGDLVIKVHSQSLEIELPNVLFIDGKMHEISEMMRT